MTKLDPRKLTLATLVLGSALGATILPGCGGDETPTPDPKVTEFRATPSSVMAGQTVNLTYKVTDAETVTITAAPGGTLVDGSSKLEDTVTSAALTANTTFTLVASRADGKSATSMVTVNVAATPDDVRIVTFTATPMNVAPNGAVTLRWEVANADTVSVAVLNGATLLPDTTGMATGMLEVRPAADTTYVLTAKRGTMTKTMPVSVTVTVPVPTIQIFAADPTAIELGGMSTLRWMVTNATMITIRNSAGQSVHTDTAASGTFVVMPQANETYTLVAVNGTGSPVTSNPVTVTVNRAARIASFTANPMTVDYGSSSELRWDVSRAPGGVRIRIAGTSTTVTTSNVLMGAFTVTPTRTTSYELIALNPAGNSTAAVTVTVNQIAPRILSFTATPTVVRRTTQTTLSWMVAGATRVRILNGMTEVRTSTALSGSVRVTITSSVTRFTLEATNPNGGNMSTVTVMGLDLPVINAFSVTPLTFIGSSTVALVTWRTTNATATDLSINGRPAMGFTRTASGTYTFTATSSARLVLTASNPIGMATSTVNIFTLIAPMEGADTASTAIPLPGDGSGAAGAIDVGEDVDFYSVVVPAGGWVTAEISDGRGGCPFDTLLTMFGPDGMMELGDDDDDGVGTCSLIDGRRDTFAANLAAGTYYFRVEAYSTTRTGPYVFQIRANAPSCGDTIREMGEQCDAGISNGMGSCSATCTINVSGTFMGPPGNMTFTGVIPAPGTSNFYAIQMLGAGYLTAETFIPSVGLCTGASGSSTTELRLYDSNVTLLGSDLVDGIDSCSKISPAFDAFASLAAGTYYLEVREAGNDGMIPAYTLRVSAVGQGCPNGIIEQGEFCDDGNNVAGDGCSPLCEFEGTIDMEPNGTTVTANTVTTTAGVALVQGAIMPANDVDFYAVMIPQGAHLDAYATVNSLDSCPTDPRVRIRVFNSAGTTIADNSTGGPDGNCGRAWPYTDADLRGMAAGRYFISVEEDGQNALIPRYFLHVRVIMPGCGNSIIEGTEQCEDGNTAGGDGCSATCTFEPVATINLPAATQQVVAGSIDPAFNRDAIRLNVTAPIVLTAETFVPNRAALSCSGADTRLRLYASDGSTLIGEDNDDGFGACSYIYPGGDAFTRLSTGTYYLVVEQAANNRTIASYELAIDGRPQNACGNGAVEYAIGEECDDGNVMSGDYCSPTCRWITVGTFMGPSLAGTTLTSGGFGAGEVDLWLLDLSAPALVDAQVGVPTTGLCEMDADTVLEIYDIATGQLVADNDDDDISNDVYCSHIGGVTEPRASLPAGRYLVVVHDFFDDEALPTYQLAIRAVPVNVCGNGSVELMNNELCDDNNTMNGDGCSSTCAYEPDFVFNAVVGTSTTVTGSIMPATDFDVVRVVVTDPIYLRAETFAPTVGTCPSATTQLRLFRDNGVQLATDTVAGINSCSLINRTLFAAARLTAGTYYVTIEESGRNSAIASYALTLTAERADACGDSIQEAAANEQCDDGNTVAGDGCSATCQFETRMTLTAPGTFTYADAITPVGDRDVLELVATSSVYIHAETFSPMFGSCPSGTAPTLTLFRSNGQQLIRDASDGINSCALINPDVDTAARVGPGRYFLRIEEDGNNATIAMYATRIVLTTANVCGNGFVEPARSEQCDDGNTVSGDGCSASCTFERTVAEVEPNDSEATATPLLLTGPGAVQASGRVVPAADLDFFSFVVPPGMPLTLRARTYSMVNNPTSTCTSSTDTRLILLDSNGAELENVDDELGTSGANRCSSIDGTLGEYLGAASLAPGTYTLRVSHYSSGAPSEIASYFLYAELVTP